MAEATRVRGSVRVRFGRLLAGFVLVVGYSLSPVVVHPAEAVTFLVDTTADTEDDNIGDGACKDAAGDCSLRAAIQEANASVASADIIELDSGATYALTLAGSGEDAAVSGDLDVTSDIHIVGNAATVTAGGTFGLGDRVFDVRSVGDLTLEKMTVTGGANVTQGAGIRNVGSLTLNTAIVTDNTASSTTLAPARGGGVSNDSILIVNDSFITENTASATVAGAFGGGIYNDDGGQVTVDGSNILDNLATNTTIVSSPWAEGGGIWTNGDADVTDSVIGRNNASTIGARAHGGGVYFGGDGSEIMSVLRTDLVENHATSQAEVADGGGFHAVTTDSARWSIENSLISENSATGTSANGGGLFSRGASSLDTLVNTTVSSNSAMGTGPGPTSGGGIRLGASHTTVRRSTISSNTVDGGASGSGGGGGISLIDSGSMVTVENSTLSGNTASNNGGGLNRGTGSVALSNVTVTDNTATTGSGGGLYGLVSGALTYDNTVVVGNSAGTSGFEDCLDSSATSLGHNLFGSASRCLTAPSDLATAQPFLGPLAANGGSTDTHALLAGSPAIGAGNTTLVADQRGVVRPQGPAPDIGAFELDGSFPVDVVTLADVDSDSHGEVVVVLFDAGAGRYRMEVRDGVDGALVSGAVLPLTAEVVDVEVVGSEVAVLYRTVTNGRYRVRLFDAVSGAQGVTLQLGSAYGWSDLEVTPGGDVAVVGGSLGDGRVRVQVVDPVSGSFMNFTVFGSVFSGDDLEVTPAGHLAVLGTRPGDGVVRTRAVDPSDSSWVQYLFGPAYSGDDLEVTASGDVVVLGTRPGDGLVRVRSFTPAGVGSSTFFGTTFTGTDLEVLSSGGVAVLGERPSNDQVRVRVENGVATNYTYGTSHTGIDLVETTAGELAVLGEDRTTGAIRVRHIDPVGGAITDIFYP